MANLNDQTAKIEISQGSAATDLRFGGIFYSSFLCSLSMNAQVKELLTSIHIYQSNSKKIKVTPFYGQRCCDLYSFVIIIVTTRNFDANIFTATRTFRLRTVCGKTNPVESRADRADVVY